MFCMAPRGCSICWEKSIGCVVVVSFAPPISVSCFCLLLVIPPICFLSLYLFIFGQCLTRLTQSCTSSVTSNGEETLVSELKRPSWLSGVSVNFVGGGVQSGCSWAWSPSMTFSLYKSKSILGSSKQCWCALIKHVCVCVSHCNTGSLHQQEQDPVYNPAVCPQIHPIHSAPGPAKGSWMFTGFRQGLHKKAQCGPVHRLNQTLSSCFFASFPAGRLIGLPLVVLPPAGRFFSLSPPSWSKEFMPSNTSSSFSSSSSLRPFPKARKSCCVSSSSSSSWSAGFPFFVFFLSSPSFFFLLFFASCWEEESSGDWDSEYLGGSTWSSGEGPLEEEALAPQVKIKAAAYVLQKTTPDICFGKNTHTIRFGFPIPQPSC